ncbi:hypothetical protein HY969_02250 [Candidatus Kaiserbacteria bacterium]|nr:hypothetical protein [Candidatus Kaiserbacteria bacterium]
MSEIRMGLRDTPERPGIRALEEIEKKWKEDDANQKNVPTAVLLHELRELIDTMRTKGTSGPGWELIDHVLDEIEHDRSGDRINNEEIHAHDLAMDVEHLIKDSAWEG